MKLNRITWATFFLLSILSAAVWLKFSYPRLAITNFSIDRSQAIAIAEDYLRKKGDIDLETFQSAAIFRIDEKTNKYLQKTIGFDGLKTFIEQYDFDMFFWKIRFFAENVKEEYLFIIDSASGEITGYAHTIDENEARKTIEKDKARANAVIFLKERFGFNPENYTLRGNSAIVRDNRSDFLFRWQNKSVHIPWSQKPDSGTGKLIIAASISGDEVLSFSKNIFTIPDQFNRDLANRGELSRNILTGIRIIMLMLLTSGIYFIVARRNHLAMHTTKKFYITIMVISLVLSALAALNEYQLVLFSYKTTLPMGAFLWRNGINTILGALLITVAILIPSLSGELLHFETSSKQKEGSLLHYIRSTFFSRNITGQIMLGYCVGMIILGMQSFLVKIGQDHWGVWVEHGWIGHFSTAYFPFLAALTFGFKTSLSEEIMFRLYAINLGKKIFSKFRPNGNMGNIVIIVLLTSLIWGFAHSSRTIFPIWFRGLEVTCLGIFMAYIYLNFGLIPVLVGHYLVDVFWNSAGYIFGASNPFYFYSSLSILLLPLAFGIITFLINRKEIVQPLRWHLNKHQLYNLEILKTYLGSNKDTFKHKSQEQIKEEIASHGWDPAVVDVATDSFFEKSS